MGKRELTIMPVRRADVPAVAEWTAEWLGAAHPLAYSLTIFSSPRYTDFLLHQQEASGLTHLAGAYEGSILLGFIELRKLSGQLFINNLCVKSGARGRQIGERLLQYTERLAKISGASTIALDCFLWNERALRKYIDSGFRETGRIKWLTKENEEACRGQPVGFTIQDQQEADAHQHAFGFSRLHVQTEAGGWAVNRLKDDYFRLATGEQHPDYYNILSQLDRRRALFLICAGENAAAGGWKRVSDSVRLEKEIN